MSMVDLAEVAAGQWGMITTAQARAVGHTPQTLSRLTSRGALERLTHGVYRFAGVPPDPSDAMRSSWLTLDPAHTASDRLLSATPGVVSHRSAAVLQNLGDVSANYIEFTAPRRRQTRRPDIRLHRARLPPESWTIVNGLPVTTPVQTIKDLARDHLDGGHLAGVIRDALVTHHVDSDEVVAALRPYAQMYGAPPDDGSALLQTFIVSAGIPRATIQVAELASRASGIQASMRTIQEIEGTLISIASIKDRLRALYNAASHPSPNSEQLRGIQEQLREVAGPLAQFAEQIQALQQALDPATGPHSRGSTDSAVSLDHTKELR